MCRAIGKSLVVAGAGIVVALLVMCSPVGAACDPGCDVDGDGACSQSCGGGDCDDFNPNCIFCFSQACAYKCDQDGDAALALDCGGDDCDDLDPGAFPGNIEVCDGADRDEDCDPTTFGSQDGDGDGYVDARCCNMNRSTGDKYCGNDCDDQNPSTHPGANDFCNQRDDDCDEASDEGTGGRVTGYLDVDGDGFGDMSDPGLSLCPYDLLAQLRTPRPGDCADDVWARHPGAVEVCNGLDDDCDGRQDEGLQGFCD